MLYADGIQTTQPLRDESASGDEVTAVVSMLATDLSLRRVACLFREASGPALSIGGADRDRQQSRQRQRTRANDV